MAMPFRSTSRLTLLALLVVTTSMPVLAQTVRVQLINSSPYPEGDRIDVYRNGELVVGNLKGPGATAYTDWPSGEIVVSLTQAGSNLDDALLVDTLSLRPGKSYILAIAGDPLKRSGEPPIEIWVLDWARETTTQDQLVEAGGIVANVGGPDLEMWWRRRGDFLEHLNCRNYGTINQYSFAPSFRWDMDYRIADGGRGPALYPYSLAEQQVREMYGDDQGTVYVSIVWDVPVAPSTTLVVVRYGYANPPSPGYDPLGFMSVWMDGHVTFAEPMLGAVQVIHNSPYPEVGAVDVHVNGFKVIDSLGFRESTSSFLLPAGLLEETSPSLNLEFFRTEDDDGADPLFSKEIKLQVGQSVVAVLAGDPRARTGQPPMDLFLADRGPRRDSLSGSTDVLFFHGSPDILAVNIGVEGEPSPLAGALGFGRFSDTSSLRPEADTLFVMDASGRQTLALFEAELAERGLVDSSLVLLTSGFANTGALGGEAAEFDLVAALPSGGPLLAFQKHAPTPWWQQPLAILAGLVGFAFIVLIILQVRLRRVQARARELSALVDERTRELRLEKEKTEEQARRLAELDEVKNRFFANISHEFRTPLTLILGPVQDALDGKLGPLAPQSIRHHALIRRNARRLLRLVNQLLDLSRMDSGKMEVNLENGDLISFLDELVRAFTPLAERRRVTLAFAPVVDSISGRFDTDHIEKIFANLISNALKFTPEGGTVTIVADLNTDREERSAKVTVIDTGPGIPEEQLDRIFDRFQQADTSTRRTHEGSGVGLTLARELAELHGGSLTAESTVGKGSRFEVVLPIGDLDSESGVQVPRIMTADLEEPLLAVHGDGDSLREPVVSDASPLILVVEDNSDVREYLRSHLSQTYRLVEAVDGEQGLEVARKRRPDLILSDVMMPVMDGYEMCRLIKATEDLRHIPVIMLTAKASERETVEGLQSGADDYVAKPFSVDELLARVSNFITVRRELRDKYSRAIIVKPGDIEITPDDEVFLDSLLEMLNAHLGDSNYSVDWLADEMGVGRRQLERRVQSVTGQTPADLLRGLRLERASQLLRAQAGTIAEIAYSVGFKSPSHFSTAFRKTYGESPSEHATSTTSSTVH